MVTGLAIIFVFLSANRSTQTRSEMGVSGLLRMLQQFVNASHIRKFKGKRAAVDIRFGRIYDLLDFVPTPVHCLYFCACVLNVKHVALQGMLLMRP